jgi:hypothetical protein
MSTDYPDLELIVMVSDRVYILASVEGFAPLPMVGSSMFALVSHIHYDQQQAAWACAQADYRELEEVGEALHRQIAGHNYENEMASRVD